MDDHVQAECWLCLEKDSRLLTGRRTIEALGASSSSSKVLFKSSLVNSRRGNMVAREKLP